MSKISTRFYLIYCPIHNNQTAQPSNTTKRHSSHFSRESRSSQLHRCTNETDTNSPNFRRSTRDAAPATSESSPVHTLAPKSHRHHTEARHSSGSRGDRRVARAGSIAACPSECLGLRKAELRERDCERRRAPREERSPCPSRPPSRRVCAHVPAPPRATLEPARPIRRAGDKGCASFPRAREGARVTPLFQGWNARTANERTRRGFVRGSRGGSPGPRGSRAPLVYDARISSSPEESATLCEHRSFVAFRGVRAGGVGC